METHTREKTWHDLSLDAKVENLREDVVNLFSIVENLSHQDHVFTDAFHLVHAKLDELSKSLRTLRQKTDYPELAD